MNDFSERSRIKSDRYEAGVIPYKKIWGTGMQITQ